MYTPKHFAAPDQAANLELIRQFPLASVITLADGQLDANLIPMYWFNDGSELGVLRGHVARANPLWQISEQPESAVLVLFQAPNHYISPQYYPDKMHDPRVVPTWNYSAVQVNGTLRAHHDPAWLLALLRGMVEQHEQPLTMPWQIDDAPAEYIERMLRAVVGIEITIDHIAGKYKQSQNQSAANQAGVRAALGLDHAQ